MKAKKKFGQHFLTNNNYISRIAKAISAFNSQYSNALEVGPGKGAITSLIYDQFDRFKLVEIDTDVIPILVNQIPALEGDIVNADFLDLNISSLFQDEEFVLSGNYPYNISSQIIFKMLDHKDKIPCMVGMFQKEVAERIVSRPNSKVYGVLSVLTQFHYEGEILFDLEPEAFDPPPKVFSSVIKLKRHNQYVGKVDEKLFKSVVKMSFNQRRKMIRNTLKSFFPKGIPDEGGLFTKRPEHLGIPDFIYICELIKKEKDESRR